MSQPIHVLLLEDNPGDARLVREMLDERGDGQFQLEVCTSLHEALGRLNGNGVDIVLTDLNLPDSEESETYRRLRSGAPSLPLIILSSAYGELKSTIRMIQEGADDFLVKGAITSDLLIRSLLYTLERRRLKAALAESEARYRNLIEDSVDIIFSADGQGRLLFISPAVHSILGENPSALVGRPYLDLVHPDDRQQVEMRYAMQAQSGEVTSYYEFRAKHREGFPVWISQRVRLHPASHETRWSGVWRNVDERYKLLDALRKSNESVTTLASQDALTGLANRRRFETKLAEEWARARRSGSSLTLMVADVDHFQDFNAQHGHPAGDVCLQKVAEVLRDGFRRAGDVISRYGGQSFAILVMGTPFEECVTVANAVVEKLRGVDLGNGRGRVTMSVGCAGGPAEFGSADALLMAADKAMRSAKAAGRDRVGVAP